MADATTGYMYDFQINEGNDTSRANSLDEHIMQKMFKDVGFLIEKSALMECSQEKRIYAVGTIRVIRKNMLEEFSKITKKLIVAISSILY